MVLSPKFQEKAVAPAPDPLKDTFFPVTAPVIFGTHAPHGAFNAQVETELVSFGQVDFALVDTLLPHAADALDTQKNSTTNNVKSRLPNSITI